MSNTKYKLQKNKTKCSILNTLFTQDTDNVLQDTTG